VVRRIYKNFIFASSPHFRTEHNYLVFHSSEVVVAGQEFTQRDENREGFPLMLGAQDRKRLDRRLLGKTVQIRSGDAKGLKGRVSYADDNQVVVELASRVPPQVRLLVTEVEVMEDLEGGVQREGNMFSSGNDFFRPVTPPAMDEDNDQ